MTKLAPRQFGDTTAPPSAFRMPIDGQFKTGDRNETRTPFSMLARSSQPVQHWYWGAIYHDFSGMQNRESIPVDYCHDDADIIGVGNKFDIKQDGLYISGHLVHVRDGDRVDTISRLSAEGVPYEASIDFRGAMVLEEVGEGFTSRVNGKQIEGPALIVRQWTLRGVAVCPHGMDPHTSSQFSADDDPLVIELLSTDDEEDAVTKAKLSGGKPATNPKVKTQQTQATEASAVEGDGDTAVETQQSESGGESDSSAAPSGGTAGEDAGATFRAELKKFTDKFGEKLGTKWFLDKKTWTEACELHAEELGRQLAASQEQNKQLQDKLKSVHHGEDVPASLSEDAQEETPDGQGGIQNRFAHMGKVGAFASALKMPGKQ